MVCPHGEVGQSNIWRVYILAYLLKFVRSCKSKLLCERLAKLYLPWKPYLTKPFPGNHTVVIVAPLFHLLFIDFILILVKLSCKYNEKTIDAIFRYVRGIDKTSFCSAEFFVYSFLYYHWYYYTI